MADGKTHERHSVAIVALSILAGTGAVVAIPSPVTLLVAVGVTVGGSGAIMVTPDVDHHAQTREENRIERHFGRPMRWLWQLYWGAFDDVAHRSAESHSWPYGTWKRLNHALIIPYALTLGAAVWLTVQRQLRFEYVIWAVLVWLGALVGWSLVDAWHLVLDNMPDKKYWWCWTREQAKRLDRMYLGWKKRTQSNWPPV